MRGSMGALRPKLAVKGFPHLEGWVCLGVPATLVIAWEQPTGIVAFACRHQCIQSATAEDLNDFPCSRRSKCRIFMVATHVTIKCGI